MANYDTSAWAKGQAKLIKTFKNAEMRTIDPVMLKMAVRNAEIMTPNYQELKKSVQRPLEGNFLTRQSRTLGTGGPTHNHTGSTGLSAVKTFTWVAYDDKVTSTIKQGNNSIFSLDEMQANQLENVVLNFAEGGEKLVSDFALASRTQIGTLAGETAFDVTNHVFEIPMATKENRAIQISQSVMKLNKYSKFPYVVACDTIAYNKFQYQANQGGANQNNLSFQFAGVTFIHDVNLSASAAAIDATYVNGFWEIIPEGSLSALPWIPVQNRQGYMDSEGMYSNIFDPLTNLRLATHTYKERVDGTSLGGNVQDVKIETQFFTYLGLTVNPLSVANESSIYAFALV